VDLEAIACVHSLQYSTVWWMLYRCCYMPLESTADHTGHGG